MIAEATHAPVQDFIEPSTLGDLIAAYDGVEGAGVLVAGATDVGVQIRRHVVHPEMLISVLRVPELQGLDSDHQGFVLGGAVTHRRVERSPLFGGPLVALQEACATVGSVQTRNVGTLAGNIVNASPAADTPPVLISFDAEAELMSVSGKRWIPFDRLFIGYRETTIRANEVLTRVRIPLPDGATGSAFLKLGRRRAMEISLVCVAARVTLVGGCIAAVGVGLGAIASTPIRASEAESLLLGSTPGDALLMRAARAAAGATRPIDDHRASSNYRRQMTQALVLRALERAIARAQSEDLRHSER